VTFLVQLGTCLPGHVLLQCDQTLRVDGDGLEVVGSNLAVVNLGGGQVDNYPARG
jgi:hypothetical protein